MSPCVYVYVYIEDGGEGFLEFLKSILTSIILYNNLIPISLIVTVEVRGHITTTLITVEVKGHITTTQYMYNHCRGQRSHYHYTIYV